MFGALQRDISAAKRFEHLLASNLFGTPARGPLKWLAARNVK